MPSRLLFSTLLHEASLAGDKDFVAFNGQVEDACRMLAAEDVAGRAWCEANAYGGYTSYASLDDLPRRASIFGDLKRRLDKQAAAFARELAFELGGGRLRLDSLWVNVLKPGAGHSGHVHPHSVLSGTYYVAMPKGAGGLRLEDPRLPLMMAAPPRLADAPERLRTFVYLSPVAGDLVMWESWLRHEALPGRAKKDRISISFNYGWR
ncbi:MAG TPA: TIGR02466 family protein [Caulobacteraceae bacterium]|nr:TIGR02466 family protein [Caulobacteraceae bacterium]